MPSDHACDLSWGACRCAHCAGTGEEASMSRAAPTRSPIHRRFPTRPAAPSRAASRGTGLQGPEAAHPAPGRRLERCPRPGLRCCALLFRHPECRHSATPTRRSRASTRRRRRPSTPRSGPRPRSADAVGAGLRHHLHRGAGRAGAVVRRHPLPAREHPGRRLGRRRRSPRARRRLQHHSNAGYYADRPDGSRGADGVLDVAARDRPRDRAQASFRRQARPADDPRTTR